MELCPQDHFVGGSEGRLGGSVDVVRYSCVRMFVLFRTA